MFPSGCDSFKLENSSNYYYSEGTIEKTEMDSNNSIKFLILVENKYNNSLKIDRSDSMWVITNLSNLSFDIEDNPRKIRAFYKKDAIFLLSNPAEVWVEKIELAH